ncbi:hypothetical protein IJG21_02695, partial [Candidatus Saccharibacteria bacterium]|nr:hypothetical protein [Candidatus Saccharibacteria bacterium]
MKRNHKLIFVTIFLSFLCVNFIFNQNNVYADISDGNFDVDDVKKAIKGAGYTKLADSIKNVDGAVCALFKKANKSYDIPKLSLSSMSLTFKDNENLTDITKSTTTSITVNGITKQCSGSTSNGISVGSATSSKVPLNNVFFGYATKNIDEIFNTPAKFDNRFYTGHSYGGVAACSDNDHGKTTAGSISRSSGTGCNAYSFLDNKTHSLTTNDSSITLKINPARFIGEDGHDSTGDKLSASDCKKNAGSYADCYTRKVFAYYCPNSSTEFVKGYRLDEYACRFQSFGNFGLYVQHINLSATTSATSTGNTITSASESQTITFTHGYNSNNTNFSGTPTKMKITQKVNNGSETTVCAENGETCKGSYDVIVGSGGISIDDGGTVEVCQYNTVYWNVTTYSAKSSGIGVNSKTETKNSTSKDCKKVSRSDPEVPTGGATFSTESSDANPQNWNDGASHDTTVTINHKINRTDTNANPSSVQTQYI